MTILRAENISKSYNDKTVIDDINIHLDEGELVSLLGISGSGKTTLFNIIAGLTAPDSGRVYISHTVENGTCPDNTGSRTASSSSNIDEVGRNENSDIDEVSRTENDGNRSCAAEADSTSRSKQTVDITNKPGNVAYMLQKDMLLPHKKIIDNVALPLLLKGIKRRDARQRAEKLFGEFGLEGTQYKYPAQLSGGMRQRAALLRTYMASDGVVLLDEPFSALDTITKSAMHRWYLEVMEHISLSTLFITHDIDEAILLSDRIYILSGSPGRIVSEIVIDEKRPRRSDFGLTAEFLEYKKQIISML